MSDKIKKDISKQKVAIIGIGFVIGVAMLIFGGNAEPKKNETRDDSLEEYREMVEEKLEALCEAMTGCEAEVFVMLEEGFSYVYALDSRGGVITVGSTGSKEAVIETVLMPRVSGVGVVCEEKGFDEAGLLDLISSSLGIGKNKIFIADRKKSFAQS